MLDVRDRLLEQVRHVVVVQVVNDAPPVAPADDEPQMTKHTQLMGDRRRLHSDSVSELVDTQSARAQATQNPHAARGRERLHRVSDRASEMNVELFGTAKPSVSHHSTIPA